MTKSEKKAMLINKMQEELDRRTEQEEEAIYLMEQGEFERANQLLKSIDDSVAKGIMEELDQLNGLEEEETKEELQGTVNTILESGTVNLVLKDGEKNTMKQPIEIEINIQGYKEIELIPEIVEKLKKLRNEEPLLKIRFVVEI